MPRVHRVHPNVTVVERGWLNANQIVLHDAHDVTLIDTGYVTHLAQTLEWLIKPEVLGHRSPTRIVNTHCHSDHMGGNARLRAKWNVPLVIPAGEARHVKPWNDQAMWVAYTGQDCEPFDFDAALEAGEEHGWGGWTWRTVAAPGHDMDALMFWCESERVLISGDALWENGFGSVLPDDRLQERIESAFDTLALIEHLRPRVVIPGHGAPFGDASAAVERSRTKLRALAQDPARLARSALKVMFVFDLLASERIAVDAVQARIEAVSIYHDVDDRFLGLGAKQLAHVITTELQRALAIRRDGNDWVPTMAA